MFKTLCIAATPSPTVPLVAALGIGLASTIKGRNPVLDGFGLIAFASLTTITRYRNNQNYSALGASGAVSAVVFTYIFFAPLQKIYFYMVLPIPGILFGILYLIYSSYMGKRNKDNINHSAHFWGAVVGFIFPILLEPSLFLDFLENLFPN